MTYLSKFITPAVIALLSSANLSFADGEDPACLVGTWAPDQTEIEKRLTDLSSAEKVAFSGSFTMIINQVNQPGGIEFQAKDWSFFQDYSDSDDSTLVVSGSAKYSLSAPRGGAFRFAEESNKFTQKMIIHQSSGLKTELERDLIPELLAIGEWAHGRWDCEGDNLKFRLISQDDAGYLSTLWHRQ